MKHTPLGNLLRQFADMVDNGTCGVTAEEFAKVAELRNQDHERINVLCDAVEILLMKQNENMKRQQTAKIIPIANTNEKKPEHTD